MQVGTRRSAPGNDSTEEARALTKTAATIATTLATLIVAGAALAACGTSAPGTAQSSPAASAGASSGATTAYLDLAYARASKSQKLDIYVPGAGSAPYPVILAIHGGAFQRGDKAHTQLSPMLSGLSRGYAVASMNYRLSGEARFPAQINDVKAAVRWLRANAATYRLDAGRIAVWGGSAGGHLAALAGTSGGVAALSDPSQGNGGDSDRVQAVVDWFGPIAFLRMDPQFKASGAGRAHHDAAGSPESRYLGAALHRVRGKVRAADATTYITPDDPPFFIEHGTADGTVPVQQSQRFAAALTKALGAGKVTLKVLPGAGHADRAFFTTPANVKLVLDWLDAQLK